MFPDTGRIIAGYDLDAGIVAVPSYLNERGQAAWMEKHHLTAIKNSPVAMGAMGPGAYSQFEMMQPFQASDDVAVTAAAETVLTTDAVLTLPANFFAFQGRVCWLHASGKQSNVATTPGTYTFRLRYAGLAGTLLVASGAIVPDPVAVTDNLWYCDLYVKALATGKTATSLTLLATGEVNMANADASLASDKAKFMPAGATSVANVASLDGTSSKALTLTVQPTVTTGSITVRDAWIVALN
jgi:hypothetical protein